MSAAETTAPRTALEYALAYAALGWSVVPVRPGEKMPAVPWAKFQALPARENDIRGWFDHAPEMGVGLVQGRNASSIVLDFDGETGHDTLRQLEARGLPASVRAYTPGGGVHVYLRHPGVPIATRKSVLPGMDVRGDGGFVVAPPSRHANGGAYVWDVDCHPEDVPLADTPAWLLPALQAPVEGSAHLAEVTRGTGSLGLHGAVTDGREAYMRDTVLAVARELRDKLGRLPTEVELFDAAWPQYAAHVDFSRPGRGRDEFAAKVRYTLARASKGAIRGFETPAAGKEPEPPQAGGQGPAPGGAGPLPLIRMLSLEEVEALQPPKWLIDGLLPERCIAVPYGPPKVGKTFVVLSMALHIAAGKPWMGRRVQQGPVVYVAGEGVGGLSVRIKGMRAHYGIPADIPFWVIPRAVNFRDAKAVAALVEAVRHAARGEDVALVVLDTLARAMPGVDENSAEEVGLVIAAADQVKHDLGATVMPVHHAGKDVERGLRGSSAIHGALDVSFVIKAAGPNRVLLVNEDQKDAEPAPPMAFRMEAVPVGIGRTTLVPVQEEERAAPQIAPDEAREILTRVVLAMAGEHEAPLRRVAEMIGMDTGHGRSAIRDALGLPGRPVEIALGDAVHRLSKRIDGDRPNSPIVIVRHGPSTSGPSGPEVVRDHEEGGENG